MLKKLSLACVALLSGVSAFAQQSITTNYGSPVTITNGNCTITGITTLTYDGVNSITTNGTVGTSCGGTTTPPTSTASVSLSITPSSYTLGSGGAAPVVNVTNNTAAAQVSCTLTPTNGFSVSAGNPVTNSGTFTLSTPTTAGTFNFTPQCTTTTTGYTVTVTPQTVALTVVANPNGGGGTTPCSATQTATIGTKSLQRLCNGTMVVLPGSLGGYNGTLEDLGAVMGGSSFPTLSYAGYSPTFTIPSGYYVSLAFTPKTSGAIQLVANPSYGDGGIVSLSTVPGGMTNGSAGTICALTRGGNNSLYVSTTAGSICQVQQGTTYYINFADVDTLGNNLCYGGRANTCQSSQMSYTVYTSQ